jgi:hypothetical protein
VSTIAPTGVSGLLIHIAPLVGAVLFAAWWGITRAPEGYEDERGFHYGPEVPDRTDTLDFDFYVWREGSE